jgi:hypothetical protein
MLDGLMRYIEEESKTVLAPAFATSATDWMTSAMPVDFDTMTKLYAKLDMDGPVIGTYLRKLVKIEREHERVKDILSDNSIPMAVKVCARVNLLGGIAATMIAMAGEVYKLREGV